MGLRYRKSINLGGGFRVNLSKSGIGYSWGVKGYRITKTADGKTRQTVSIPGTGISYVDERKGRRSGSSTGPAGPQSNPLSEYSDVHKVSSADINSLRSPAYDELFSQNKRIKLFRTLLIVLAVLTIAIPPVCIASLVALAVLLVKGRCSISYEFEDGEMEAWTKLSSAWRSVADSKSLQEITLTAKSKNAKKTAGIENAVSTEKVTSGCKLPWYLTTNIHPIVFKFHGQQVAIMPDRLLILGKRQLGAIDYSDVKFGISAIGFVETGPIPSDSERISTVWAYANKDGSPDKRYSNNKQFPVMKYGKIVFTSPSGLNIQLLCSDESASDRLNSLLNT